MENNDTLKLAISSDHAGFELKELLKEYLLNAGHEVKDYGTDSPDSVDYPDYIHPLATSVEKGEYPLGIIICGSGNGAAITANKHQGIRAAIAWNAELGSLARKHNDANILSLPARFITTEEAKEIVLAFLNSSFEGGRHARRVNKIPIC